MDSNDYHHDYSNSEDYYTWNPDYDFFCNVGKKSVIRQEQSLASLLAIVMGLMLITNLAALFHITYGKLYTVGCLVTVYSVIFVFGLDAIETRFIENIFIEKSLVQTLTKAFNLNYDL